MTNEQIQLTLEYGKTKAELDLMSFLQNKLDLNYNDRTKAYDFLISKHLFTEKMDRRGEHRITTFGLNILNEFGTYEKYVESESKKIARLKEKEETDLILAKKMLKEFPKTKWFARIGLLIAIGLALKELYILFF